MLTPREIEFISEKAKNYIPSKQAFSCMKGKGCSKEKCPAWVDITWTMEDIKTGDKVKMPIVGCQFILRPIFDADIIETTYRNIDSSREVSKRVDSYTERIGAQVKQGLISIMKFIGVSDVKKVLEDYERLKIENEELKKEKLLNASTDI